MAKKIGLISFLFIACLGQLIAQEKTNNPSFRSLIAFDELFKLAAKEKKPILFEAYLPTCSHCIAYDKTLRDPKLKAYLQTNYLAYQLDLSKKENNLFLRKYHIYVPSTPSFIVFSPEGKIMDIEPLGDETNSVGGIQQILNRAKNPLACSASLLEKYRKGEKNMDLMLSAGYFSRLSMDTTHTLEIVNEIVRQIPKQQYQEERSFLIMQKIMLDDENPLFQYFISNLSAYKAKFDSSLVSQTAENVLMSSLYCSRARNYSPIRMESIKSGLRKLGLPEPQIAMRTIVLEVLIDLDHKDLEKAKAKILGFYGVNAIPDREKEFWCKQLARGQAKGHPCPLP